MKGSREVLEMEENGEIEFNENTQCYEEFDWQDAQTQDQQEMKNDAIYEEERERRAGLLEACGINLKLRNDQKLIIIKKGD